MPVEIAQQSGIEAWITQYGNIVYFFGQLGFWLVLALTAIFAVVLFKRLVDYKTGALSASDVKDSSPTDKSDAEDPVKIDEFVE